jgi:DNA-directed RNA polymerase II subunit RPB2
METECITSHGLAHFFKERFMECSDAFGVNACATCGNMVAMNVERGVHFCDICGNSSKFKSMNIPYAAKLAMQVSFDT